MDEAIRFVGDLQVLSLQPGDTLVLRCDSPVSNHTASCLERALETRFPGHKALVLSDGMELGVVSPTGDRLGRIEAVLDKLVAALADEPEDDGSRLTLDGGDAGAERDQSQAL